MAKEKKETGEVKRDDALFETLSKNKKRKRRRIILTVVSIILVLAIVAVLVVGGLQRRVREQFGSSSGEVLSYEVTTGSISTLVSGSGTYSAVVELQKAQGMLSGMTATATVVLSTADQVLTVPAAALVEAGTRTLIYTGYDEEKETLLNPVEVIVGVSDGATVQILEGITAGQTYYYAYYDTLEVSVTPDFGSGFFGR